MKRRQVLLTLGALAVGGGAVSAGLMLQTEAAGVAAVLYKRLSYLTLDGDGVRQFAQDYVARGLTSAQKLRVLSASRWVYSGTPQSWLDVAAPRIAFGEERIVSAYLLGSDFFPDCDESRITHYLGFYDGRTRANPFARLVVQSA
jgi:hypothetical protein